MIPENVACLNRNIDIAYICPYDNEYTDNLAKNMNQDFKMTDISPRAILNFMRARFNTYTPQSKRIKLSK